MIEFRAVFKLYSLQSLTVRLRFIKVDLLFYDLTLLFIKKKTYNSNVPHQTYLKFNERSFWIKSSQLYHMEWKFRIWKWHFINGHSFQMLLLCYRAMCERILDIKAFISRALHLIYGCWSEFWYRNLFSVSCKPIFVHLDIFLVD